MYKKICRICGKEFETYLPGKLYCSDECKKEGKRKARNKYMRKYLARKRKEEGSQQ